MYREKNSSFFYNIIPGKVIEHETSEWQHTDSGTKMKHIG